MSLSAPEVTNSTSSPKEFSQKTIIFYDILDGDVLVDLHPVEGEDSLDCAHLDQQGRRDLAALVVILCLIIFLLFIFWIL